MLFILVMDVLNRLFIKASANGLLQPIGHSAVKHQCSMYADDVILFAAPTCFEAIVITRILEIFGDASGLRTNLNKCSITHIFGCEEAVEDIQSIFRCQVAHFPIKYLGLPLSTRKLPKSQLRPIMERLAVKLPSWKGPMLQKSGRLILVKSVLSSIPTYSLMADKLPAWLIEEIDTIRRKFLWSGCDASVRGKCVVAWGAVCRPLKYGGLGVPDLKLAGFALRVRWLWLQRVDRDRAWSALNLQTELEVQALFDASVFVRVGNGERTLFWTDAWLNGQSIKSVAPAL